MIIKQEIPIRDFRAWSGGVDTLEKIIEANKCEEFEMLLEDIKGEEEWSDFGINDLLWFESEWIFEQLGITEEDEESEEDEENN